MVQECTPRELVLVMNVTEKENKLIRQKCAKLAMGKKSKKRKRSLKLKLTKVLQMVNNIPFMEREMKFLILKPETL